jgi:uncharacterized protein (TIGR03083 family)
VDSSRYLEWIRADGERLAAVAELGLDEPVPSCPGWTVADLVAHTGVVHRHKAQTISERWTDGQPAPVDPPAAGVLDWYRRGLDELLDTLAGHDPAEPVATWYPEDQSVGFWYRRMACETVVHRVDAELAHAVVTPIPSDLAADAVDEVLVVFMAGYPEWAAVERSDRIVRLEAVDSGAAWTLRYLTFSGTSPRTGTAYEAEPTFELVDDTEPATLVMGAAEDLLLFLWGRRSADGLSVSGDASILDDLRRVAADVTQ